MSNKKEIMWNIINSLLAGALVLLGSLTNGNISFQSFMIAIVAAGIIAISKFKDYWNLEQSEYSNKIFNFTN